MNSNRCYRVVSVSTVLSLMFIGVSATAQESPVEGVLQDISNSVPQRTIAEVIEDICPAGVIDSTDLQSRCTELVVNVFNQQEGGDLDSVRNGLQAMAAEEDSVLETTLVETSQSQNQQARTIGARLAALRGGAAGRAAAQGLQVGMHEGLTDNGNLLTAGADGVFGGGASADGFSRLGAYLNGRVGFGSKDPTALETGFDLDTIGVTGGIDYRVSDSFVVGGSLSWSNSEADLDNNGGSLDSDDYSIALYASYYPSEAFFVDFIGGYGWGEHEQKRAIRYSIPSLDGTGGTTVVDQIARAKPDSDRVYFSTDIGYDFVVGAWTFGPTIGLDYTEAELDGFTESLSNPGAAGSGLGLTILENEFESLRSNVGFQVSRAASTSWGVVQPYAALEWVHEFEDDGTPVQGFFNADSSKRLFSLPTDRKDEDHFVLDLGLSAVLSGGTSLFVNYTGMLGYSDIDSHLISAGLRAEL